MFAQILNAVKVTTASDGGKSLMKKLSEYGGLDGAVAALKHEKQLLTSETQDLDKKAKLKGSLQTEIANLQVKKDELEGSVAILNDGQGKLSNNVNNLKNESINIMSEVASLNDAVAQSNSLIQNLDAEIKEKTQKVAGLDELQSKHGTLMHEMAQVEIRLKAEKGRLSVLDGFLGLVYSIPLEGVKGLSSVLPAMIKGAEEGKYSPEVLRIHVLETLTGGTFRLWRCPKCSARFYVDKPAGYQGYVCPWCHGDTAFFVYKNETEMLRMVLPNFTPVRNPVVDIEMISKPLSIKPAQPPDNAAKPGNTINNT
jgi:hypothetical protein